MALYQVLYWKDIPAQVKVFTQGRRSLSRQMPPQFQEQIDARAMQERLFGTDEYLQHWRWSEKQERDLPAEELLEAIVRELEQDHGASGTAGRPL